MMAIIEATLAYKRSGPCCRDDGVGEEAGDQSHEQPIGQKVLATGLGRDVEPSDSPPIPRWTAWAGDHFVPRSLEALAGRAGS